MSSPTGLGFRESRWRLFSTSVNVTAELQLVVYSLETMSLARAATASRWPDFVSHAIATCSWFGPFALAVISVNDPHALPLQIQAFASSFVSSAPIRPIWSLPGFEAILI